MKKFIIFLLYFYKKMVSPFLTVAFGPGNGCIFEETCSQYAIRAISKYGAVRGGRMSLSRLLSCQPFSSRNLKYESI